MCISPGLAVSPLENSSETNPTTDRRAAEQCCPGSTANVVELTPVTIDACCTHSSVVNSGVIGPNFAKFLENVEKPLPSSDIELAILQSVSERHGAERRWGRPV